MADEVVSHAFDHGVRPDHAERLAAYWAEALGGPETFSAAFGDETPWCACTAATVPTRRWTVVRSRVLIRRSVTSGVEAGSRLSRVLHDYFAWATTTTMSRYHASADDVPDGLDIPKWSWDGLVP